MPISDTKARQAKPKDKAYRLADDNGLYLDVQPSGRKSWRVRYFVDGKEGIYTIGQYPGVGLKEARAGRDWAKHHAANGVHPKKAKEKERAAERREQVNTFGVLAEEWYRHESGRWSAYYARQVRKGFDNDILPALGDRPIKEITPADILELITGIADRGAPSVATLVRQWIGAVYGHAINTLRVESDPTQALRRTVRRVPTKHSTSLTPARLADLSRDIDNSKCYRLTQIAMQVLMLTMLRTGEMRQGLWQEIDWERKEWRVPKEKMKRRIPHVVPLSDQVMALLTDLHGYTGGRDIMFPNNRRPNEFMTNTTINTSLVRMGWGGEFSGHGFRATASTLLNQHGWRGDLIEKQLAHSPGDKVRAAYNHADYLDDRRRMLQWWADYIDGLKHDAGQVPSAPIPA
ncbi:tyrosine-type recombinase/integrase [Kushneria konosiri]|nr:tyrosine-type recombinase/integrase [Kushneria konosiri]